MSFRLVPKSVTLNDLERRNVPLQSKHPTIVNSTLSRKLSVGVSFWVTVDWSISNDLIWQVDV